MPKLALSDEEVAEILRASEKIAILVGGQALSVWANFYRVAIPGALTANVTRDADFNGSADAALIIRRPAVSQRRFSLARKSLAQDPTNGAGQRLLELIAQRRAILASAAAITLPRSGVTIPLVESDPLPPIHARTDGHEANLLLDTGALDVVPDPDFAHEAGLTIEGGREGVFARGRKAMVREATAHDIEVGPVALHELKVGILPSRGMRLFKGHVVVPMWLAGDHFVFVLGSINNLAKQLFLVDSGGAGASAGFVLQTSTLTAAHMPLESPPQNGVGGGGAVKLIRVVAEPS